MPSGSSTRSVSSGPGSSSISAQNVVPTPTWLDSNLATHQLDQLLADRQTEPGAYGAPFRVFPILPVAREHLADHRVRNASPRVPDGKAYLRFFAGRKHLGGQSNGSGVGELDRVAHEVEQHLADAPSVTLEAARSEALHPGVQIEALDRCPRLHQRRDAIEQRADVECAALELDLPLSKLRKVEDLVHDLNQRVGRLANRADHLLLLLVEVRVEQEAAQPEHAVHRRTHLVAHVCHHFRLGCRGSLCGKPKLFHVYASPVAHEVEPKGDGREAGQVAEAPHPADIVHPNRRDPPRKVAEQHDCDEPLSAVNHCPGGELDQHVEVEDRRIFAKRVTRRHGCRDDQEQDAANVNRPHHRWRLGVGAPCEREHGYAGEPVERQQPEPHLIQVSRQLTNAKAEVGDARAKEHRDDVSSGYRIDERPTLLTSQRNVSGKRLFGRAEPCLPQRMCPPRLVPHPLQCIGRCRGFHDL